MHDLQSKDIIDFRAEIFEIKQKYGPRYHCEGKAIREAAALWGAQCNEHGVLNQLTDLITVEHKRYTAAIHLYETGKFYWHVALSFSTPDSGFGSPASVWTGTAFSNDLAARRWAVYSLSGRCHGRAETYPKDADLAAFRNKLEEELTPQLALF